MPLHPQAKRFLEDLAAQHNPTWQEMGAEKSRDVFNKMVDFFGKPVSLAKVRDAEIAKVPVRIYRPTSEASTRVIVYFHGGGWVLGNLDTHDALCRRLAAESRCTVVSVNYRLAPENPYPAAFNDAYNVTAKIAEGESPVGPVPGALALAGDRAGGNLAAAVCLAARDRGGPEIDFQFLIYPVIEPQFDSNSYQQFAEGYGLTLESMQWFWDAYVPDLALREQPYANPAAADSLSDLPPAYILTAEYDVLRDEGELYADRLKASGVSVNKQRFTGMIHGFVHFAGLFDVGEETLREAGTIIRSKLA